MRDSQMVYVTAEIARQDEISDGIFSMLLYAPQAAGQAHAGQFVSLFTEDPSRLLPRPISICEADQKRGYLRLVYRVAGEGTRQFSNLRARDKIRIMGPLGNGYDLGGKHPILLGGGIGIPPMLELAKEYAASGIPRKDILVVNGYRSETFLLKEFEKYATVYVTSDTGKSGIRGNVIDGIREYGVTGDRICACGPKPMLRAVKKYAYENDIEAYLSLEERMACGIGACLGCVVSSTDVDAHSGVKNKRVCCDGPVFRAEEVEI